MNVAAVEAGLWAKREIATFAVRSHATMDPVA
jgi:hypothetical protein